MKKVIKYLLLFTMIIFVNKIISQKNKYSLLNLSELYIINNHGKEVPFFCSKQDLILNFGQPLKITTIQDADMLDYGNVEEYKYDGISFLLESRPNEIICISFEITNSNYGIKYRNNIIRTGDLIENIYQMKILTDSFYLWSRSITPDYLRVEFIEENKKTPYYSPLIIEIVEGIEGEPVVGEIRIALMI